MERLKDCSGTNQKPLIHISGYSSLSEFSCLTVEDAEVKNFALASSRRENVIRAIQSLAGQKIDIAPKVGSKPLIDNKYPIKRSIFSNIEHEGLSRHVEIEILYGGECHI